MQLNAAVPLYKGNRVLACWPVCVLHLHFPQSQSYFSAWQAVSSP